MAVYQTVGPQQLFVTHYTYENSFFIVLSKLYVIGILLKGHHFKEQLMIIEQQ